MVVELAVLAPVVIVMALVCLNLMRFLAACARFDRVAQDAVISQGVSPEGEQDVTSSVEGVRTALEEGMGQLGSCEVEVSAEPLTSDGGTIFSLAPRLTRYRCTLRFSPWPSHISVAGVDAGVPLVLEHERSVVVDRYRSGVVV